MARPAPKIGKVRLNLELSPAVREHLDELRERVGADTLTEVIRRAIALYSTLVNMEEESGVRLFLKGKDGKERELIIPREFV